MIRDYPPNLQPCMFVATLLTESFREKQLCLSLLGHRFFGSEEGVLRVGTPKLAIFFLSESVKSETHDWASDEIKKLRFMTCTVIVSILHVNSVCAL